MSSYQNFIRAPDVKFYHLSEPMIGHIIPGVLHKYPVVVKNYSDLTEAIKHRKAVDPLISFPNMHDDHSKGHSMIDKLKSLLSGKQGPKLAQGYERMSEDLSWKGQSHLANHALKT